jgi:hypothetical protein
MVLTIINYSPHYATTIDELSLALRLVVRMRSLFLCRLQLIFFGREVQDICSFLANVGTSSVAVEGQPLHYVHTQIRM